MSVVIDTPEGIQMFALLQVTHRLALEINTGLKFRQSSLAAVQRAGYTSKRTKKSALKDMVTLLQEMRPDYVPRDSIARALNS